MGAAATVAATVLLAALVRGAAGAAAARVAGLVGALTLAANLFAGRLTFALGCALALGALLAAQRDRPRTALALAVAATLGSPVAGLFLALAGAAWALGARRGLGVGLAAAALVPPLVLAVAFPAGGTQPFALSSFWPTLALAAAGLAVVPREWRTLRVALALYAAASLVAFALPTPVGGNAVRLGALFGAPALIAVLWPARRALVVAGAGVVVVWAWLPSVRDVRAATGDPSVAPTFSAPLLAFLERRPGGGTGALRVEVPLTRNHWETTWLPGRVPIARGWERQFDRQVNGLFYEGELTPPRYRRWLDDLGVSWVAVPDVALDASGRAEAALVRSGAVPGVRPVWRGPGWRVWRVSSPRPLVSPPGRLLALGPDDAELEVPRPGDYVVRVRFSPHWALVQGRGCVEPAGPWTRVRARRAGRLRLAVRLDPLRALGARAGCRQGRR